MDTKREFRCNCPVTSAVDVLGDKWTLVIVKHLLLDRKQTFKELAESDESIATNILSSRLKMLQEFEIVRKVQLPRDRRTSAYVLTEKGLDLAPIVVELALWSDRHLRQEHPDIVEDPRLTLARRDRAAATDAIVKEYEANNSGVSEGSP